VRTGGPRLDSLDHLQYGVHYGIVCQNKDPENLNRVKIRLPWLDEGDTDQLHWAQLATPMEGAQWGWLTIPDIDDVVAVVFIAGDTSQPVVIGGVWSTPDNSPEPNSDGKNNFRGYRSRSGHRMILDDTAKTKVVFADKTLTLTVGIGNFAKDGEGPNVCAVFKPPMAGDVGVSISSMEGNLEITCKDGTFKIDAGDSLKMNAKTTVDLNATGDMKMDGSSTAKLTAADNSNYDGAKVDIA
jgi:uncharacterized protein involved in type VI secretion and phage assembly